MRITTKLVFGLIACFALSGCGDSSVNASGYGNSSVSAEEFRKEVNKIEDHQYSSAVISYYIGKSTAEDEFENLKEESDTAEFAFDANKKGWNLITDIYIGVETIETLYAVLDMNVKTQIIYDKDKVPEGYKIVYYINPLKISTTVDMNKKDDYYSISMKGTYSITFDKYGFVTDFDTNLKTKTEMSIEDETLKTDIKTIAKLSISYK